MDLQTELAKEHSRAQADRIVAWVGADPRRFDEVLSLMLGNDRKLAQRAAWVVSLAGEARPELLAGRVGNMLGHLRRPDLHPAVPRAVFRLLQSVRIPGPHQSRVMELAMAALGGTATVAVKVYAMTISTINGISRSSSPGGYTYEVNPGSANKPITYTSWFNAARFCNWLHNGQGNGSTETGAYTLSGIVQKNADAKFWIPTEDEWYKAAYYDPTKGGTGGYWLHPTRSDTLGGNTIGSRMRRRMANRMTSSVRR